MLGILSGDVVSVLDALRGRSTAPQPFDRRPTVLGVMTTPRQPRLESSSTAQISDSAEVSPGERPITFVRRRTSTKGART